MLKQRREQQSHKTIGIRCEINSSVVATLSEGLCQRFLTVTVPKCRQCQKRWWHEQHLIVKRGIPFSAKTGLLKVQQRDRIRVLSWMSDCNSTFHLKICTCFACKWSCKHKLMTSSAILKPIFKFLYQNRKHSCMFLCVPRTEFSQCFKMSKIICHSLC